MTFWQENYPFIKEVYAMRNQKMADWMESVEKSISRILADKVYTSAEFKRERDSFQSLCKDLERTEVKKWLQQILEILMGERAKEDRKEHLGKLDALIKKHEELIPTVLKTQVMVDLYWRCYAYGDELKPHIEFLDGIMVSSTRDIAPSCIENVEELIERQEKSLLQLETKRAIVKDLIAKGKQLLESPDKPKFLDNHVRRIEEGWDFTKQKASERLEFLNKTKLAWEGYAEGLGKIQELFDKCDEEAKKVKKRFNLASGKEDLEKRKKIFNDTKNGIEEMHQTIMDYYNTMTMTLPEEKKDFVKKEVKEMSEKMECVKKFEEKVTKIEAFVTALNDFDQSLKKIDEWMQDSTKQLKDLKDKSGSLTPDERISFALELHEDVSAKMELIKHNITVEADLLPQGDKVPQDAQDFKEELKRIYEYVTDLEKKVSLECQLFSEDVRFWAEYRIGITKFRPWLLSAEAKSKEGLSKPGNFVEANALFDEVKEFQLACTNNLKILSDSEVAAHKMTTHLEADQEIKELKEHYDMIKVVADGWVQKVDTLVKEWTLLDHTVTELNTWVTVERTEENEQKFSLEKMESTLGELKNIFKEKERLVENL